MGRRGRAPCCDKVGLNKGSWSLEEDMRLIAYIEKHGHGNWRALPKLAGLLRCGKSCRLRWINYLRPDIKRGNFTKEEEEVTRRSAVSPSALVLKGLPAPEGKHLRFQEEDD